MKKKLDKNPELADIAKMLQEQSKQITLVEHSLGTKIDNLEKYMKQGFETLNDKIDTIDEHAEYMIRGLDRRLDTFIDDKVSKIEYKELTKRVSVLESYIPKTKHR